MVARSLLVQSDKVLHVKHVLVHKSIALVHKTVLGIEDLGVSSKYYVLNNVGVLVHFSLCIILFIFAAFRLSFLVLVFPLFLMVFSHHILFTYLVITVVHLCKLLLFEKLEFLQLDKLYVFYWALRGLFHFIINHFRQNRVCWNVIALCFLLIDGSGGRVCHGNLCAKIASVHVNCAF